MYYVYTLNIPYTNVPLAYCTHTILTCFFQTYDYIHRRAQLHSNASLYSCRLFNQMVYPLMKAALPTLELTFDLKMGTQRIPFCCPPPIDSFTLLKELCTAASLFEHNLTYSFQRSVALLSM